MTIYGQAGHGVCNVCVSEGQMLAQQVHRPLTGDNSAALKTLWPTVQGHIVS